MKRKSALPFLLATLGIVIIGAAVVMFIVPDLSEPPQQMQAVETSPQPSPAPVPETTVETEPEETAEHEWTIEDTARIYLMKFPEIFDDTPPRAPKAQAGNYMGGKLYQTVSYEELARNANQNKGNLFKFTGTVFQEMDQSGNYVPLLIEVPSDINDDLIYATVKLNEDGARIMEGDRITIYGECTGLRTYTTTRGDTNHVPEIYCDYWEIH